MGEEYLLCSESSQVPEFFDKGPKNANGNNSHGQANHDKAQPGHVCYFLIQDSLFRGFDIIKYIKSQGKIQNSTQKERKRKHHSGFFKQGFKNEVLLGGGQGLVDLGPVQQFYVLYQVLKKRFFGKDRGQHKQSNQEGEGGFFDGKPYSVCF